MNLKEWYSQNILRKTALLVILAAVITLLLRDVFVDSLSNLGVYYALLLVILAVFGFLLNLKKDLKKNQRVLSIAGSTLLLVMALLIYLKWGKFIETKKDFIRKVLSYGPLSFILIAGIILYFTKNKTDNIDS